MSAEVSPIRDEMLAEVASAEDLAELEQVRVRALGKKGRITALTKSLGQLDDPEARRAAGQAYNELKEVVAQAIAERRAELEASELERRLEAERIDVTLPVRPQPQGRIHPVSQVAEEITAIFADMGFEVAEGPDVEDDFHNFTALNIPPEHPARQMQDTFFLEAEADAEHPLRRFRMNDSGALVGRLQIAGAWGRGDRVGGRVVLEQPDADEIRVGGGRRLVSDGDLHGVCSSIARLPANELER